MNIQTITTDELNAQIFEIETQLQRMQQTYQLLKSEQSRRATEFIKSKVEGNANNVNSEEVKSKESKGKGLKKVE